MSAFPLFESLFNETKNNHNEPFSIESQDFVLQHIQDLDEYGREIFYSIIRQDQLKRYPNSVNELPNSCKQMKSGIRIDFDKIPIHVKYMLEEFIKRHLNKINEDISFFNQKTKI